MELSVDRNKKKAIAANRIRCTKRLRCLRVVSWACLLAGIAGGALFCTLCLKDTDMYMVSIRGVMTKEVGRVVSHTVTIVVLGCIFSIFSRVLLAKLSGRDINERTDESMTITDDEAVYSFRIRIRLFWVRNVVVRIPFRAIDGLSYDDATGRIDLAGNFTYVLYKNAKPDAYQQQNAVPDTTPQIAIYDYFTPSLYETLNDRNYTVKGRLSDEKGRV